MIRPCVSLKVDQAITLCSEMHNIKEAIYENKSKLEGIGEDYQIQVGIFFFEQCSHFLMNEFSIFVSFFCLP